MENKGLYTKENQSILLDTAKRIDSSARENYNWENKWHILLYEDKPAENRASIWITPRHIRIYGGKNTPVFSKLPDEPSYKFIHRERRITFSNMDDALDFMNSELCKSDIGTNDSLNVPRFTQNTWLISANNSYNTIRAFNELRTLEWDQGRFGFKEGDIIYIYLGKPIQKIRIKCRVDKTDIKQATVDDRKYFVGITDEDLEEPFEGEAGNWMRLTALAEYVDSDLFGIEALSEHGIHGRIRTPRTLSDEALEYLEQIDVDNNILKFFKKDEIVINEGAVDTINITVEEDHIDDEEIIGDEREVITKARINHSVFKQRLVDRYGQCALCGMNMNELLIASHIKPWAESSAKEKTSVENGLLLCPNHDRLFDKGYIAFENDGSILISSLIAEQNYDLLGINRDMRIDLTDENIPFIEYHRKNKHIW